MKNLLLLTALLVSSLTVGAQDTKKKYVSEAAQATCDCMATKSDEELAGGADMVLGLCMFEFVSDDVERFETHFGELDFNNTATMESLGESVGLQMVNLCPSVMMTLVGEELETEVEVAKTEGFVGTYVGMAGDELMQITFKQDNGRNLRLLWLSYFPGSELLLEDQVTSSTKLRVSYETMEIFDARTQDYVLRRVVTGVEKE